MLRKPLAMRIFDAFTLQRWNDCIRPVEFTEMDKSAHKMIVAYCLGKSVEAAGGNVRWDEVIRGGIFELLRRVVISDIKSPICHRIRVDHPDMWTQLNNWAYEQLKPCVSDLSNGFPQERVPSASLRDTRPRPRYASKP